MVSLQLPDRFSQSCFKQTHSLWDFGGRALFCRCLIRHEGWAGVTVVHRHATNAATATLTLQEARKRDYMRIVSYSGPISGIHKQTWAPLPFLWWTWLGAQAAIPSGGAKLARQRISWPNCSPGGLWGQVISILLW